MKRKNLWLLVPFMLCLVLLLSLVASAEEEKEWLIEREGKIQYIDEFHDEYDWYEKFSIDDREPGILDNQKFLESRKTMGDKRDFILYSCAVDPFDQFPDVYHMIQFYNIKREEAKLYFGFGDADLDLLYGSDVNAMREAYRKSCTFAFQNRFYTPAQLTGLKSPRMPMNETMLIEMAIRGNLLEYLDFMLTQTWTEEGSASEEVYPVLEQMQAFLIDYFEKEDPTRFEYCVDKLAMTWARFGAAEPWDDVLPKLDERLVTLSDRTQAYRFEDTRVLYDELLAYGDGPLRLLERKHTGFFYVDGVLHLQADRVSPYPDYLYFRNAETGDMTTDIRQAEYRIDYIDEENATMTLTVYVIDYENGNADEYMEYRDLTVKFSRWIGNTEWEICGGTVITELFDVRFPVYESDSPDTGDGPLVGVAVLCLAAGSAVLVGARKRKF